MLDRKFILDHAEAVKLNCQRRGVRADVDQLVHLETARRAKLQEVEELNRQANEVSKSIGRAADTQERDARKEQGRQIREQKEAAQHEHDRLDQQVNELQRLIPNMSHPDAPIGTGDEAAVARRHGITSVRATDFPHRDHVDLGQRLDLFDFEAGARVTGHGFYFLKNEAVLLELGLQRFAIDHLRRRGFTPLTTPDLARNEILEGIGFIPRGEETQIYSVANSDLSLVATAEITLGGMYADQIVSADQLPIRLCGISHCFRTEAGAHGRATRGIYRVHQFTKVEMFAFSLPEQSDGLLEELCQIECELFDQLEIPYRVVDTATGDLGGPAYRKYDLEAWMPGRGTGGEWGEVTSTSNCTDYQARRLNIRYRKPTAKGTDFVHTLNGTAVAISRALIALLENHQQPDGSITIPTALQAYVGFDRIGTRP